MKLIVVVLISSLVGIGFGLENGLARTPPMGWLSWERFRCNTDCVNDPLHCIGESLFYSMADMMAAGGYKDVGYEYIIIDDCWLSHERDADGNLQADPERFPSGIPALADYIHSLGLKFGIYEDYGTKTCGGYPGILGHMEKDAQLFAKWGVDYVKLDGCNSDIRTMAKGYPEFGKYLNETGRPMVYSCSWPAYLLGSKLPTNYTLIAKYCNLWRNYDDISDSFQDVLDISDYYGDHQSQLIPAAGPGHWNDPDMLIIGDFSLSYDQAKVQMATWAIMASPLIMSADLRVMRPEYKEILQNRNVIKINQDPLGIQGKRLIHNSQGVDIWMRPILPKFKYNTSAAVSVTYRGTSGVPVKVTFNPKLLGLNYFGGYTVTDVFSLEPLGSVNIDQEITIEVNPNGVRLLRLDVNPINNNNNNANASKESMKMALESMSSAPDIFNVEYPGERKNAQ